MLSHYALTQQLQKWTHFTSILPLICVNTRWWVTTCVLLAWAGQMIRCIINCLTWFTFHTTYEQLLLLCVTLWTSHLTSNTECAQRSTHLLPDILLLSLSYSPFLQISSFTILPPLHASPPLSQCVCARALGEQRLIARGKSSTLLGWPSSDRVIHPSPFTSPYPLHCALFPFIPLPPKQTPLKSPPTSKGLHVTAEFQKKL